MSSEIWRRNERNGKTTGRSDRRDGQTHSLNSKCLRVILKRRETVAQVEIKVAETVPIRVLSTKELVAPLGIPPRLVSVLDFPAALADKLAAWNERRLARDLYDIWFFTRMGVRPDLDRLKARLLKPAYAKRIPVPKRLQENSVEALHAMLREEILALTDEKIAEELRDYLPEAEFTGLSDRFRSEMVKAFG